LNITQGHVLDNIYQCQRRNACFLIVNIYQITHMRAVYTIVAYMRALAYMYVNSII